MTDSYLDAAAARDWCAQRGISRFDAIEAPLQPKLLLQASEWIDRQFVFAGKKLAPNQLRAWPREAVFDNEGDAITGIPELVIAAVVELTILLAEDVDAAEQALGLLPGVSQQKAGGIEIRYDRNQGGIGNSGKIALMLAPLLRKNRDMRVVRG